MEQIIKELAIKGFDQKPEEKCEFEDISSEAQRTYTFPNGLEYTIDNPLAAHRDDEEAHRIITTDNVFHFIKPAEGWAMKWTLDEADADDCDLSKPVCLSQVHDDERGKDFNGDDLDRRFALMEDEVSTRDVREVEFENVETIKKLDEESCEDAPVDMEEIPDVERPEGYGTTHFKDVDENGLLKEKPVVDTPTEEEEFKPASDAYPSEAFAKPVDEVDFSEPNETEDEQE